MTLADMKGATKEWVISRLSSEYGITTRVSRRVLNALFKIMIDEIVEKRQPLHIAGLGTFKTVVRRRKCVPPNLFHKKGIYTPRRYKIVFSPSITAENRLLAQSKAYFKEDFEMFERDLKKARE